MKKSTKAIIIAVIIVAIFVFALMFAGSLFSTSKEITTTEFFTNAGIVREYDDATGEVTYKYEKPITTASSYSIDKIIFDAYS